jgi:hypothetical protein
MPLRTSALTSLTGVENVMVIEDAQPVQKLAVPYTVLLLDMRPVTAVRIIPPENVAAPTVRGGSALLKTLGPVNDSKSIVVGAAHAAPVVLSATKHAAISTSRRSCVTR